MFIHAHLDGEDDLSFYEDSGITPWAVWIYMPIDPGERVVEIWRRSGKLDDHMGLAVRLTRIPYFNDLLTDAIITLHIVQNR